MHRRLPTLLAGLVLVAALPLGPARADPAQTLAGAVADRPANEGRVGTMHFKLTNSAGKSRDRTALMVHSEADEVVRIAIFFTKPAMIADTAFLSHDRTMGEDENWLYLPATERVRRLPSSERSGAFMGTDLSYGDVKDDFKFPLEDWTFSHGGNETYKGRELVRLEGTAKTAEHADDMGYASFSALIDPGKAFPVLIEYTDSDGDPLKRVEVTEFGEIGGAWTALAFSAENVQTGHRTDVHFTGMRHVPNIDDSVFDADALAYGIPAIG